MSGLIKSDDSVCRPDPDTPLLEEGHTSRLEIAAALCRALGLSESIGCADNDLGKSMVLVSMSGPHGTDIVAALTSCLKRLPGSVVVGDLSFSRIHHNVTFALLVQLDAAKRIHEDQKSLREDLFEWADDVKQTAARWHADVRVDLVGSQQKLIPDLEDAPYANRGFYAATILGPPEGILPSLLSRLADFFLHHRVSIVRMKRLDRGTLGDQGRPPRCLECRLSVPTQMIDVAGFRDGLFRLARESSADAALQTDNVFRRSKRLVVFDFDSTLVMQEGIDELAREAGEQAAQEVSRITEQAMRGELDFETALRGRAKVLCGLDAQQAVSAVRSRLKYRDGAPQLCRCLKMLGYRLAVVSGGFVPFVRGAKEDLGLDYAFANALGVDEQGKLTGEVVGTLVTGNRKAELLEVLAQAEGIVLDQVVAVGDGANDLLMLARAGLGISFNGKPLVEAQAPIRMRQDNMLCILYLLGYSEDDITTLLQRDQELRRRE